MCQVINRAQWADGIMQVRTVEELTEDLEADDVDLAADMHVAVVDGESADDGAIAGFVHTLLLPSEVLHVRCYVFGDVEPAWRGQGIGTALMTWGIARARQQLDACATTLPTRLRAQTGEDAVRTRRMFERLGMRAVRYHEELLRPLIDLPPLTTPRGVRIVAWPDDRDDEVLAEKNLSWVDHWGSTPTSPAGWQAMVRGFGARPEWSFIAVDADTDEVVGHCLCKRFEQDDALTGRRDGYIDSLGTLQRYRGRGVGAALIVHAFHALAEAGMTHAALNVDSENPTGAARLYRSLGFVHERGEFTYELA